MKTNIKWPKGIKDLVSDHDSFPRDHLYVSERAAIANLIKSGLEKPYPGIKVVRDDDYHRYDENNLPNFNPGGWRITIDKRIAVNVSVSSIFGRHKLKKFKPEHIEQASVNLLTVSHNGDGVSR